MTDFEWRGDHLRIKADDEWLETQALIIASGASARWLGLENEEKLIGHGLTSLRDLRRRLLSQRAGLRDRRRRFRGGRGALPHPLCLQSLSDPSPRQIARLEDHGGPGAGREKIEPIWNTVVTQIHPGRKRRDARRRCCATSETHEERKILPVACVFVAIGHDPNTKAFQANSKQIRTVICS